MNYIISILEQFISIFNNEQILSILHGISFSILAVITYKLFKEVDKPKKSPVDPYLFLLFLVPIAAILIENIQHITLYCAPKTILYRVISCIAWIFACFKFHSFLLFIELLINKQIKFKRYHIFLLSVEILFCFLLFLRLGYIIIHKAKHPLSDYLYSAIILFTLISVLPLAIKTLQNLSNQNIPLVLKNQIKTLFTFFFFPHLLCVLIEFSPYFYMHQQQFAFGYIALLLITASFYFCFKRIMQFRFLNLSDHVQTKPNLFVATDFKQAVEQINVSSSEQELSYISQQFFFDQMGIAKNQVTLYIRSNNQSQDNTQKLIEKFLSDDIEAINTTPTEMLLKHKILVNHEIEFDEFYTDNPMIVSLANFLRSIQCDIFLPIFNNKKLIGYITVAKQLSPTFYNLDQQNEMMVFAQFLAPAIYMMQQQNTYTLLQESKQTKEELYEKQQEINQYKESIKQLLKDRLENHIGIIFYKSKHFAFKNQEAQSLLNINPNLEPEHPTTTTLVNFAQQIEKYQTAQNMSLCMPDGSKLMISGMPHAQTSGGALLIIRKPEATDLIKMHIDALKNPSQRDYLLYLETTKAGQIINKLLPSNHETFVHIKIQLLQAVLQKNALLLQAHADDIGIIVETIHQLSGSQALQVIDLQPGHDIDSAKIFGINPLLTSSQEPALLDKLTNGTLLIKNIELLDIITQQKLAHMMRYGIFTPIKSEQRKFSDTRIICATTHNLSDLLHEGIIAAELYEELKKHTLTIPSLITMDQSEVSQLIDGFMCQNLQIAGGNNVRALNYKEKELLLAKHIASLFALQQKVTTMMNMKAQEIHIAAQEKTQGSNIFDSASPELQLASQLGKHALKDVQLMKNLWKKLGNQTKIADLLGVNRSSVNRRCKEYNLI